MGFQRKKYRLVWPEESIWNGLEVALRGMTFDELQEVSKLRGDGGKDQIDSVLEILAGGILEWNLEDESGTPVPWPPVHEDRMRVLRNEDTAMITAILMEWTEVVGNIPTPLPKTSPDGKQSVEASIPMEIPSESHLSLSTPS